MRATRAELDQLAQDLQAARELLDEGQTARARKALFRVRRAARRLGVRSSYLRWCLAALYQALGEPERAFGVASAAVMADPLHPALGERFADAARGMREALREAGPGGEAAPRLYAALLRVGEADASSHLALARHALAGGRAEEAGAVLRALTVLEPGRAEAWRLLAEVARRGGAPEEAAACEARAVAAEATSTPYGVPSPGLSC